MVGFHLPLLACITLGAMVSWVAGEEREAGGMVEPVHEKNLDNGVLMLTRLRVPVPPELMEFMEDSSGAKTKPYGPKRAYKYWFTFVAKGKDWPKILYSFSHYEYDSHRDGPAARILDAAVDSDQFVLVYNAGSGAYGVIAIDGNIMLPNLATRKIDYLAGHSDSHGYIISAVIKGSLKDGDLSVDLFRNSSFPPTRFLLKKEEGIYAWEKESPATQPVKEDGRIINP